MNRLLILLSRNCFIMCIFIFETFVSLSDGTGSIDQITFFRNYFEVVLLNNILSKLDGCSFEFINQPNLI
jgi:hypothetical protein